MGCFWVWIGTPASAATRLIDDLSKNQNDMNDMKCGAISADSLDWTLKPPHKNEQPTTTADYSSSSVKQQQRADDRRRLIGAITHTEH